jgi:hypothetical protein
MNRRAENTPYSTTTSSASSTGRDARLASASRLAAAMLWVILAVLSAGSATAPAATVVGRAPKQSAAAVAARQSEFSRKVGIYHWGGRMAHSMQDGVDRIAAFGGQIARVALAPTYLTDYNMGTGCYPDFSLGEAAKIPDVQAALGKPSIRVYAITAYDGVSFGDCATHRYLSPAFTSEHFQAIADEYAELTLQLHRAYQDSGKTFILSNWEGDNAIYCGSAYRYIVDMEFRDVCEAAYPGAYGGNHSVSDSVAGMIQWLQARRQGIDEGTRLAALENLGGVEVKLAVEISMVRGLRSAGLLSVLYDVVPYVKSDYVSYSAYESTGAEEPAERLQADLDVIESVADGRQVMLGEIGYSRSSWGAETPARTNEVIAAALNWGVSLVIYWNLFDQSDQVAFGLFDLEGEPTAMSEYFSRQYRLVLFSERTALSQRR